MFKFLKQKTITSKSLMVVKCMPDSGWWLSRSLFTQWLSLSESKFCILILEKGNWVLGLGEGDSVWGDSGWVLVLGFKEVSGFVTCIWWGKKIKTYKSYLKSIRKKINKWWRGKLWKLQKLRFYIYIYYRMKISFHIKDDLFF